MKKINKIVLIVFSVIILILGVGINLLVVGWLDFQTAFKLIKTALTETPSSQIILILTELCMLFAIICIFMDSPDKKSSRSGRDVLMQNDNGKLMISRETIENLSNTVVKRFSGVVESSTRIQLDENSNVTVLVDLTVTKDVVIKELTLNLQNKIKEAIKKTSDLEVKEVNVRIRNIANAEESNKE